MEKSTGVEPSFIFKKVKERFSKDGSNRERDMATVNNFSMARVFAMKGFGKTIFCQETEPNSTEAGKLSTQAISGRVCIPEKESYLTIKAS